MQVNKTLNALQPVVKRRIWWCYSLTNFDKRRKMTFDIQQIISTEFASFFKSFSPNTAKRKKQPIIIIATTSISTKSNLFNCY